MTSGTTRRAPEEPSPDNEHLVAFARPHDIEIFHPGNNGSGIEAAVSRIYSVGPTVYVDLERLDTGDLIEAEMSRDRCRELNLSAGARICFTLRNFRIFPGQNAECPEYLHSQERTGRAMGSQ